MSEKMGIDPPDGFLPPSPINGNRLPASNCFGSNNLTNKPGRPPNAGNTIKEWVNIFSNQALRGELDEVQMRKWAKDPRHPWPKRMALNRILTAIERPDIADFEPALDGQMSLRELRGQGVDTAMVKKCKKKERSIASTDGGEAVAEIEREIELHDRSADAWRDIIDDTDGKPMQTVNVQGNIELRAVVFQFTDSNGVARGSSISELRAGVSRPVDGDGAVGLGGGGTGDGKNGIHPLDVGADGLGICGVSHSIDSPISGGSNQIAPPVAGGGSISDVRDDDTAGGIPGEAESN